MTLPPIRRLVLLTTIGAMVWLALLPLNPVNNAFARLLFLAAVTVPWSGLLFLSWGRRSIRIAVLVLAGIAMAPWLLPGRSIDRERLRADYVEALLSYEGRPYHWGGESRRGIDCSGLPRRALRDALLTQGLRDFNGFAIRTAFSQWWHDASALALSKGYRNETLPLGVEGKMKELDIEPLLPGDLAITLGGGHALVYVGGGFWIQADPGLGTVVNLHAIRDENPWFSSRVTIHRWSLLKET